MKIIAVVFAALLASVTAKVAVAADDQRVNERFVEGIVAGVIEDLSNQIVELGMDPLYATGTMYRRLPVTDLLVVKAHVEELLVLGLSNIVLNRVNYSILFSRLTFEVSLPLISTNIGSSSVDLSLFGYQMGGSVSGSLDIQNIRVTGDLRLSIGIISGISVRSIDIDFTLGGVRSDLQVVALGKDLSEKVNQFAGVTVPSIIAVNRNDINRVIEHYMKIIIENNL